MSKTRRTLLGAVAAFVGLQLVPLARTNPPVEADVPAPPEVKAILRRSCYDCHSNETAWGWTTRVAPASFLTVHDVSEARGELNFSRWGLMEPNHQAILPQKIQEELNEQGMPPMLYLVAHPSARLSDAERATVVAWARGLGATAATAPAR